MASKFRLAALCGLLLLPVAATAQMLTGNTTQAAVTIAVTDTFQAADAQAFSRKGCTIQYRGANTGYVFFGASPTKANSFALSQNQAMSCGVASGLTLSDQVWITATAADTFVVAIQR